MNVYVRVCRRRSKCYYCGRMIEAGDYQIVCSYYMKLKTGRNWLMKMLFHASPVNCWLDRAMAEISTRPHIETRGRKANPIDDTSKATRLKMLRRRASVLQRIELEMEGRMRPARLLHLTKALDKLVVEIEPYGGVPKSWL